MKPKINFCFLQTHNSTIYSNNNVSKFIPRGRRRWDKFKRFLCMYYPSTYTKSNTAKHSLFNVCRMLQHIQRNFELYWNPARDLSINEKTIGFQGRQKDKIWIRFQNEGDGFQSYSVFDSGYMYYFIYCNDGIPESKYYICVTSEGVI